MFVRRLMAGALLIDPVDEPGPVRLDGTAATLWWTVAEARNGIGRDELVDELASVYDADPAAIAAEVADAVAVLVGHGAIDDLDDD